MKTIIRRGSLTVVALCSCLMAARPDVVAHDHDKPIKDLRVLAVIYRGATNAPDYVGDAEYASIVNAINIGRTFYFRNTRGELNLTMSFLPIDTVAPSNEGGTYEHIEADLRRRGYVNNQFDGVFTTGRGLLGNLGGFVIFDKTGAAFGGPGMGGQMNSFPSADTNTGFDTAWIFVHEFQHALDYAIAGGAGFDEFLMGHPYTDSAESPKAQPGQVVNPGGQHWDWEACTLRNFRKYLQIPGATGSQLLALDSDGDGLADDDAALPMDERRFGTDPLNPDTDGDGLGDLEEFTADIYLGADPHNTDTDGDGMPDGVDQWPTVAIAPQLGYALRAPQVDGVIEAEYTPLLYRWYAATNTNQAREVCQVYTCWDEETLYVVARAPRAFTLEGQIDTSADNGFWVGGDTYLWRAAYGKVPQVELHNTLTAWPGAQYVWSTDVTGWVVVEMALPARLGVRGVTSGQEFPEDRAQALTLLDGQRVSFNLAFDFAAEKERVLMTPPWTMVSTVLKKDPRAPDLPTLRYSQPQQATTAPVVRIEGVGHATPVSVLDDKGRVLGQRSGPGWVQLSGVTVGHDPVSSLNTLIARTAAGQASRPFALSVDTAALPPTMRRAAGTATDVTLTLAGEPGATVVLECEAQPGEWLALSSVRLSQQGVTNVVLDPTLAGFRGEYFNSEVWTNPVMYRLDRVINFEFEDGTPLRGIVTPDNFSVRWTGYLSLPSATTATFFLGTDDGSRLLVDDALLIDYWGIHEAKDKPGTLALAPGVHRIVVEYYEHTGWAAAHLAWQPQGGACTNLLPVQAVATLARPLMLRVYQTDELGNVSAPSAPLSIQ